MSLNLIPIFTINFLQYFSQNLHFTQCLLLLTYTTFNFPTKLTLILYTIPLIIPIKTPNFHVHLFILSFLNTHTHNIQFIFIIDQQRWMNILFLGIQNDELKQQLTQNNNKNMSGFGQILAIYTSKTMMNINE